MNSLQRKNKILVDFNMMIDTDIGSCLYLLKNSKKRNYFKDHINSWSYLFIRYEVITRKNKNPISVLFKEEYQESSNTVYKELEEKKWGDIISVSPLTDIFAIMMIMSLRTEFYDIIINCKNEFEERKIKTDYNREFKTVINETDFMQYVTLYIHDMETIFGKKVVGKPVFLYDYALNYLNQDMKSKNITEKAIPYYGLVEFSFISPYKEFELY